MPAMRCHHASYALYRYFLQLGASTPRCHHACAHLLAWLWVGAYCACTYFVTPKLCMQAYAMTEASHQMTSNPLPANGPHKPGTVGTAQGSVQVAILDSSNQSLPPGKIGEVCIRGPNVTRGYLNNPKANEEAFAGPSFSQLGRHLTMTLWLKADSTCVVFPQLQA